MRSGCWRRALRAAALAIQLLALVLPQALQAEPAGDRAPSAAIQPTANPLLWRIEGEPPSYLYGTIHVPDPRVLALPASVQGALQRCDAVYTEIPLDADMQVRALQAMTLPAGQTLQSVLPHALYVRVQSFLAARGVAIGLFQNQKIWVLASVLPILRYVGMGEPLDQRVFAWAQQAGKRTAGIETVEMQVAAMESAGREGELALLRETLDYVEKAASDQHDPTDQLVDLYLAGDEDSIAAAALSYVNPHDPVLRRVLDALIEKRNDYMAETIAARLRAEPGSAHFFAVGAMHYPGERGLLAQLRARGLHITRMGAQ